MARQYRSDRHLDEEKIEIKKDARHELRSLIASGNQTAYVTYVRKLFPDTTDERMEELIALFHSERRKHPNDET